MTQYRGDDPSMLDRLIVDKRKVSAMARAVDDAMVLKDPVNRLLYAFTHPNGLKIENRTVPFGTILIIYESRPDVTIEAAVTAFKAGNRILLKGGKEARRTNLTLVKLWHDALTSNGVSADFVRYLDISRKDTQTLIRDNSEGIDLIIPRGGEGLIRFVRENTSAPVIVSGRGNNFLYIDADADFNMAVDIILNGKARISVCNALDKVLIHRDLAQDQNLIKILVETLHNAGIEVLTHNKEFTQPGVQEVTGEDVLNEEFLAPKILLLKADDQSMAIETINRYSGGHSASIVTNDLETARRFMQEVDCAAVYHNASTRFTDGGQFGFGAEMAISTQKTHFRGPVGIDQLVTNKWFCFGNGHIRQ